MFAGLLLSVTSVAVSSAGPVHQDAQVQAAESDRDPTFGNDGLVLHELSPEYNGGGPIPVEDANGRLLVIDQTGGLGEIVVRRFTPSGQLDTSFGAKGQVIIDYWTEYEFVNDAAIDDEGRLVMVGQGYSYFLPEGYQWLVLRMNPDGTLDDSFGSGGVVEMIPFGDLDWAGDYDYVASVDIDSKGRIVFGGVAQWPFSPVKLFAAVGRLTTSGSLDPSFGGGEIVILTTDIELSPGGHMAVDSADRIVGAVTVVQPDGSRVAGIYRLTTSGAIDQNFGSGGSTLVEELPGDVADVVIDDQGRILVLESIDYSIYLGRFLANGQIDTSYGQDGLFVLTTDDLGDGTSTWANGLAAYPGGRAVILGDYYDGYSPDVDQLVLRITDDGHLDTTFSGDGVAITDLVPGDEHGDDSAGLVMVDSANRIVTAAQSWTGEIGVDAVAHLSLVRYLAESDGPIDLPNQNPPDPEDPPEGGTGTFVDDDDSIFEADIEWLASTGITRGCNPPINDRFCPNDPVTRGQMAAFLNRALDLEPGPDTFTDTSDSVFSADIGALAAAEITRGCNPPANTRFCPGDPVTRGQMAAFLVRALGYSDNGGGDLFVDDNGSVFEGDIDRLGTAEVTRGCNPPTNDRFCPGESVTRGQMAAFLYRALSD